MARPIETNATYTGPTVRRPDGDLLASGDRVAWHQADRRTGTVTVVTQGGDFVTVRLIHVVHDQEA